MSLIYVCVNTLHNVVSKSENIIYFALSIIFNLLYKVDRMTAPAAENIMLVLVLNILKLFFSELYATLCKRCDS